MPHEPDTAALPPCDECGETNATVLMINGTLGQPGAPRRLCRRCSLQGPPVFGESAEITRLRARVAELEAALRPFAVFAQLCESRRCRDETHFGFPGFTAKDIPTVGDCRRAAALLATGHTCPAGNLSPAAGEAFRKACEEERREGNDQPVVPLRDHLIGLSNGGLCVRCGESGHRIQSHPDMACRPKT